MLRLRRSFFAFFCSFRSHCCCYFYCWLLLLLSWLAGEAPCVPYLSRTRPLLNTLMPARISNSGGRREMRSRFLVAKSARSRSSRLPPALRRFPNHSKIRHCANVRVTARLSTGRVVCVVISYGHFFVEHNRGHHKLVKAPCLPHFFLVFCAWTTLRPILEQ